VKSVLPHFMLVNCMKVCSVFITSSVIFTMHIVLIAASVRNAALAFHC
jgi:hypothetical protein